MGRRVLLGEEVRMCAFVLPINVERDSGARTDAAETLRARRPCARRRLMRACEARRDVPDSFFAPDSRSLEEQLDEVDDFVMDRSPADEHKVKLFGAWLDEDSAGRKAGSSASKGTSSSAADERFSAGVTLFNRGRYREAIEQFERAIQEVGEGSREGGQYTLWQAQAYDALGDKESMKKILTRIENAHPDSNVRKVAREVVYILTAPKLRLDDEHFVSIPRVEAETRYDRKKKAKRSLGHPNLGSKPMIVLEKGPEKYSLEWFLQRPVPPESEDLTGAALVGCAALAIVFSVLAFSGSN